MGGVLGDERGVPGAVTTQNNCSFTSNQRITALRRGIEFIAEFALLLNNDFIVELPITAGRSVFLV